MRVTFYSTSITRSAGGIFTAVQGLASALAALGVEVDVVGGADQYFDEDKHAWKGVNLHSHPLNSKYGWSSAAIRLIEATRPDLLHVHGIWTAASIYGTVRALQGKRVVVSPHGMLDPWILSRKRAVKRLHAALLERPMLKRAYIHALNKGERSAIGNFQPGAEKRTFVIPNGIPPVDHVKTGGKREGALFVGRLHEKKQPSGLIKAWRASPALASVHLTIAGWGNPAYEREVRAQAQEASNVTFVGPVFGKSKEAALRKARFFILPSLSEGLPMAVLEALQHGAIPIITDECNLPELFAEKLALRIEANFSDFTDVVSSAFNRTDADELSARGMKYAERYHWTNIANSMLLAYRSVLSGSTLELAHPSPNLEVVDDLE